MINKIIILRILVNPLIYKKLMCGIVEILYFLNSVNALLQDFPASLHILRILLHLMQRLTRYFMHEREAFAQLNI